MCLLPMKLKPGYTSLWGYDDLFNYDGGNFRFIHSVEFLFVLSFVSDCWQAENAVPKMGSIGLLNYPSVRRTVIR